HATSVAGLTLQHVEIESNATNSGVVGTTLHEWNARFDNCTGTATISNSLLDTSYENVIGVVQNNATPATTFTITASNLFVHDATINDCFFVEADISNVVNASLTGSTVNNCHSVGFDYNGNNSSSGSYTAKSNSLDNNGGGGTGGADLSIFFQGAGQ